MLIISFTVSPARSLETMTTLVTSCGFLFAGMCLFFMFPLLKRAEKVLCEIITKKYDFYCDGEALKVVRKYRCHPVYTRMVGRTYHNLHIHRVPRCMSPRRNWDSPTPLSRQRVRGWGSPNSDDWRKSLELCLLYGTYIKVIVHTS